MTTENDISLGHILQDLRTEKFAEELRTSWSTALIYRAPSVPLVWVLARAGLGPMAVSLLAVLVALSLPVQAAWLPLAWAPLALALSGVAFQLLDCADGMLARALGKTSAAGGHADFLTDMMQWGLLYIALGILADRTLGTGWGWTAVAGAAAWARLLARVVRDRLDEGGASGPPPSLTLANAVPMFLAGISGVIPFLAFAGDWLGVGIVALLVYGVLDVLEGLVPLYRMLRR